ncbi:hypothetical protein OWV82_007019 [Melia azedarach]|uniref:Uncharacterized protein n=2 Tax=Melia azedarach TaxID=155640 RepID=A0ACC1YIR6_MELAZ|nr:hypothetical protein OWV82_007019 [Melia azedarach]KAJ4723681.1 hypothetical protein OWV82_007019 [Melia azedarach]
MTDFVIFSVHHGGSWVTSSVGVENYIGGRVRLLPVQKNVNYQQLSQMIYAHLKMNPEEFSISIRTKFKEFGEPSTTPILADILNDSDVLALMHLNIYDAHQSLGGLTPLYITFDRIIRANPIYSSINYVAE